MPWQMSKKRTTSNNTVLFLVITCVYNALKASLSSYGATFENIVKENLHTTDIETMKKYNYVRK